MTRLVWLTAVLGSTLVLSACSDADKKRIRQQVDNAVDTVQDVSTKAVERAKEGLDNPVNATNKTNTNVKNRERLMEDAGGKMIDDMR